MNNKIKMKFTAKIKNSEYPDNPCKDCGLSVGEFGCMNRDLCPSDTDPGKNYYRGRVYKTE